MKQIKNNLTLADDLLIKYSKQKIDISWNEYKKIINSFILKCMKNYIPVYELEKQGKYKDEFWWENEFWLEDNYIIDYLKNSISNYMKNYEKEYYGITRKNGRDKRKYVKCEDCGKMFLVNSKDTKSSRCDNCQKEKDRINDRKRKQKQRKMSR
jgi:ribosomal protein S27E